MDDKLVYLVTVPKMYKAPGASKYFFYNTHWFTVQIIPNREEGTYAFVIISGFARHYRTIDYFTEWPENTNIPSDHRLKMNRQTWAGTDIPESVFMDVFLARLELMMQQVSRIQDTVAHK